MFLEDVAVSNALEMLKIENTFASSHVYATFARAPF
jgi:hypothetical protein